MLGDSEVADVGLYQRGELVGRVSNRRPFVGQLDGQVEVRPYAVTCDASETERRAALELLVYPVAPPVLGPPGRAMRRYLDLGQLDSGGAFTARVPFLGREWATIALDVNRNQLDLTAVTLTVTGVTCAVNGLNGGLGYAEDGDSVIATTELYSEALALDATVDIEVADRFDWLDILIEGQETQPYALLVETHDADD